MTAARRSVKAIRAGIFAAVVPALPGLLQGADGPPREPGPFRAPDLVELVPNVSRLTPHLSADDLLRAASAIAAPSATRGALPARRPLPGREKCTGFR